MAHMVSATRRAAPARGTFSFDLAARIRRWREVARSRRALERLDAAQLRDIGLEPDAAQAEAGRPFWDAPNGWR